jgi:hypothetical protein
MAPIIYEIDPDADTVIILQNASTVFAPWSETGECFSQTQAGTETIAGFEIDIGDMIKYLKTSESNNSEQRLLGARAGTAPQVDRKSSTPK